MQPKKFLVYRSEEEIKEYLTKLAAFDYWDDDLEWMKGQLLERIPALHNLIPVNMHVCCSHALGLWYVGNPMAQCVLEIVSMIDSIHKTEDKEPTESMKNFDSTAEQVVKDFLDYFKTYTDEIIETALIKYR